MIRTETLFTKFSWRIIKTEVKLKSGYIIKTYYTVQRREVILGIPLRWVSKWSFFTGNSIRNSFQHKTKKKAQEQLAYWEFKGLYKNVVKKVINGRN